MIQIKKLSSADAGFHAALEKLLAFEDAHDAVVDATVADILTDIKTRGDEALLEYTRRFDRLDANIDGKLSQDELKQAGHRRRAG